MLTSALRALFKKFKEEILSWNDAFNTLKVQKVTLSTQIL